MLYLLSLGLFIMNKPNKKKKIQIYIGVQKKKTTKKKDHTNFIPEYRATCGFVPTE
jgi:hypothetical protein